MKKSNDQQYAKARKDYGKDFFAKTGSSSDSGLKKGATTMEKDSVKVGRFATGGAMRQPRDGNMKFAKGGAIEDKAQDKKMIERHNRLMHAGQPSKVAKGGKPFGRKPKPEDAMAMAEEKTMTKGFPRNKAAKFATGGAAKPVKRNMGGMMGDPAGAMGRLQSPGIGGAMPPVGAAAGALGRLRPPAGQMAPPSPMAAPPMEQQGGEGGQFRKGGAVKPVKLAMGGVGKQRHNAMSKSGAPMRPAKASKSEQVI